MIEMLLAPIAAVIGLLLLLWPRTAGNPHHRGRRVFGLATLVLLGMAIAMFSFAGSDAVQRGGADLLVVVLGMLAMLGAFVPVLGSFVTALIGVILFRRERLWNSENG